jgi:Fe-S-cluster containining protein
LKADAERISNQTSRDISEFAVEVSGSEPYIYEMRKTEEGKCLFLKDNRCTIYEIRPLICMFYPFELKNLGNNRYIFSYTNKCPGIGKGPKLKTTYYKKLFNKLTNTTKQNTQPT